MVLIAAVIIGVLFVSGWSLLMAFPVKWLWNYAAVSALGVHTIGFWQALCLLMLCGFLFKSTGSSKSSSS